MQDGAIFEGMTIFLRRLLRDTPWTLAAISGDSKEVQTFRADRESRERALDWMAEHGGWRILALAGRAKSDFLCHVPTLEHVNEVYAIGIRTATSQAKALRSLQNPPTITFRYGSKFIAAWVLDKPASPKDAEKAEQTIAERFHGERLNFFFPVPPDNTVEDFTAATISLKDAAALEPVEEERELFVDAADVKVEPISWLKEGLIENGTLTLFYGREKVGKSQGVCYVAARVAMGGEWFDGSLVAPEARGSVLFFETEDSAGRKVVPRLVACGYNPASRRIKMGMRGVAVDLSKKSDLAKIVKMVDTLGDVRLIVLSPLLKFFPGSDMNEAVVRAKIEPLTDWAEERNIAIIGVMHVTKDGKNLGGSSVFLKACRAAVEFAYDEQDNAIRYMTLTHSNSATTGNRIPYDTKGVSVTVDGVKVGTSKLVWLSPDDIPSNGSHHESNEPQSVTDKAIAWMEERLKGGAVDSKIVIQEGMRLGFSEGTVHNARKRLGIGGGGRGKSSPWALT